MSNEKLLKPIPGWLMVFGILAALILGLWGVVNGARGDDGIQVGLWTLLLTVAAVSLAGFAVINPNEATVVTLFGVYKGSIKEPGFWWVNPFTSRKKLSCRVRNFESSRLKVNDHDGNPIEIAAVVVWRIVETFEAVFKVND